MYNPPTTPGLKDVRYPCCSIPPDTFLEHAVRPILGRLYLEMLARVAAWCEDC